MQITFLPFFAPGTGMKINQISSVDAEAYLNKNWNISSPEKKHISPFIIS